MTADDPEAFDWDLTEEQILTIQVLCGTGLLLFALKLAFAVHNVIFYLIKRRERGKIIIIFYVLVMMLCLSSIAMYALSLSNPDIGPILFDDDGVELDDIFQYIIHASIISIGVIVIVTMYQVMISVRTMMGLTSA